MSDPSLVVDGFEYVRPTGGSSEDQKREEIASYCAFLESKYNDIAALNKACDSNYASFDEFCRNSLDEAKKVDEKEDDANSSNDEESKEVSQTVEETAESSSGASLPSENEEAEEEKEEVGVTADEEAEMENQSTDDPNPSSDGDSLEEGIRGPIEMAACVLSSFWRGMEAVSTNSEEESKQQLSEESDAKDSEGEQSCDDEVIDEEPLEETYTKEGCFVIMANSRPVFYLENYELARTKMRELARTLRGGYRDYNAYLEDVSPDRVNVVGNYRYYLVSHTRILDRLRIRNVPKFADFTYADTARRLLLSAYGSE